jgi:methionyl-tRNA formyltransferase
MAIAPDDTSESLAPRLAADGAGLMVETLRGLEAGSVRATPQDHARATLAPILTKEDGRMDFARTAQETRNRLRGFTPWPGAFTSFRGKTLAVTAMQAVEMNVPAGEIAVHEGRVFVGCAAGTAIELLEVQPEGKKRMPVRDFLNGYRPQPGERLGA